MQHLAPLGTGDLSTIQIGCHRWECAQCYSLNGLWEPRTQNKNPCSFQVLLGSKGIWVQKFIPPNLSFAPHLPHLAPSFLPTQPRLSVASLRWIWANQSKIVESWSFSPRSSKKNTYKKARGASGPHFPTAPVLGTCWPCSVDSTYKTLFVFGRYRPELWFLGPSPSLPLPPINRVEQTLRAIAKANKNRATSCLETFRSPKDLTFSGLNGHHHQTLKGSKKLS